MIKYTQFMDMYSGGGNKIDIDGVPKEYIYIASSSEEKAIEICEEKLYQDPYEVACDCCGENFSVSTYDSLKEATAYERNCKWVGDGYSEEEGSYGRSMISLEDYLKRDSVLFIEGEN